jgi:hypothetical protein
MNIAKYTIYYVDKDCHKQQVDLDDLMGITCDKFFDDHPDCQYIVTTVNNYLNNDEMIPDYDPLNP